MHFVNTSPSILTDIVFVSFEFSSLTAPEGAPFEVCVVLDSTDPLPERSASMLISTISSDATAFDSKHPIAVE